MNKYLLVIGAAENVLEDILIIKHILSIENVSFDYMCIGLDACNKVKEHVKYIATYHKLDIDKIRENRSDIKGNLDYKIIGHEQNENVNIVIPFNSREEKSGSSALLGVYAAQIEGYNKIILCGCPLEGKSKTTQNTYEMFRKGWEQSKKLEREKVRSMSGWTKVYLGAPDNNWLFNN